MAVRELSRCGPGRDLLASLLAGTALGGTQFVGLLQVHPKLQLGPEITRKLQGAIRRDTALPIQDRRTTISGSILHMGQDARRHLDGSELFAAHVALGAPAAFGSSYSGVKTPKRLAKIRANYRGK